MKIVLTLILVFNICFGLEDSEVSGNLWHMTLGVYDYDSHPIERPCALNDLNCIREVFAHHSHCTPVYGRVPDPYYSSVLITNVPLANQTAVMRRVKTTGFNNWKVKEFYLNKATDRLVFAVDLKEVDVSTPQATLYYHRKEKEPIDITDFASIQYTDVSLTLTIPNLNNLDIKNSHTFGYLNHPRPTYQLGPAFSKNPDPTVQAANQQLNVNLHYVVREIYVNKGPALMSIILKNSICDFGKGHIEY